MMTESATEISKSIVPGTKASLMEKVQRLPKVYIGGHVFTFDMDTMSDCAKQRAAKELRETPELREESLRAVRELVKGDTELVVPDEDEFYEKFLRPCKWYPTSAFHLIQRFYRFRVNYPHMYKDLVPKNFRNVLTSNLILPLPLRTKDGCRVVVIEAGGKWNPKEIKLEELFQGVNFSLEAATLEPDTQACGVHVIINMQGFSISQVTYFTPRFAAMLTEWVQRCLPCRLKGIHVVNQPFIFNMVFAIFKPFLSEKIRKRIHFHGTDYKSLKSYINEEALPSQFGGKFEYVSDKSLGEDMWRLFCTFDDDFEAGLKYGYPPKAQ